LALPPRCHHTAKILAPPIQATLSIIDQSRKAMQRGDLEEYLKTVAGHRRKCTTNSSGHWTDHVAFLERPILCVAKSKMHLTSSAN